MRVLILLLLITLPLRADVEELHPPDKKFRMSDRILFVVDTSGSMTGSIKQATDSVLLIARSGVDDCQVGLITFTGIPIRWPGVKRCVHKVGPHLRSCARHGWAMMPTEHQTFTKYLLQCSANGFTAAETAIRMAMKDGTSGLTIVLVTDGDYNLDPLAKEIVKMRKWRKKNKLKHVYIMIWGVGSEVKRLIPVAKLGGGGLWRNK